MEHRVDSSSPYVDGFIINYGDGTSSLERPVDPTIYHKQSAGGSYYITREGDELDALAQRFYGDFKLWHIIMSHNIDIIEDTLFHLPAGLNLYIPSPRQFS